MSCDVAPVVNGVQPTKHQNGLSSNGEAADFEEIIKLSNHSGSGNSGQGQPADPIMAFEGREPFMMKAGPMKPQHVAGKILAIIRSDKILYFVNIKANVIIPLDYYSLDFIQMWIKKVLHVITDHFSKYFIFILFLFSK